MSIDEKKKMFARYRLQQALESLKENCPNQVG